MEKNKKQRHPGQKHRRTTIGNSANSRPKNKNAKRNFKKYKGQGK